MTPIYDYHCPCGTTTTALRLASTRNDFTCPTCGKRLTPSPSAPALAADRDTEGKSR